MIRVVIDTNVFVSALRNPLGNEAAVVQTIRGGATQPFFSPAILAEYGNVLHRPRLKLSLARTAEMLADLQRVGKLLSSPAKDATQAMSPDPSDTKFITCAVGAGAEFLITGNRRHFPEPFYGTAEVVNARQLLDRLTARP